MLCLAANAVLCLGFPVETDSDTSTSFATLTCPPQMTAYHVYTSYGFVEYSATENVVYDESSVLDTMLSPFVW
jgi:hypothetical protein